MPHVHRPAAPAAWFNKLSEATPGAVTPTASVVALLCRDKTEPVAPSPVTDHR
ncbi:MAG: hypothetical protein WC378_06625 [Opitutaceae bacterium]